MDDSREVMGDSREVMDDSSEVMDDSREVMDDSTLPDKRFFSGNPSIMSIMLIATNVSNSM